MVRYEVLKDKPKQLLSLTGFTPEEFSALFGVFSKRFTVFVETKTLDGRDRKKRAYAPYKNSCFPTREDMLLFILMYLRKGMTQDVLGAVFGIDQPVANKWIHLLLPIVNEALADFGELPVREPPVVGDETSEAASVDAPVSGHFFFMMA